MIRRLLIILLLVPAMLVAQEVRRPAADLTPVSPPCTGTLYGGAVAMPQSYDASGSSTYSSMVSVGQKGGSDQEWTDDMVGSWSSPTGAYSSLTLNIDSSCAIISAAACQLYYSNTSTPSWQLIKSGSWVRETTSTTINSSTNFSYLKVYMCVTATDLPTTVTRATLNVYDIYTSGTLAASGPRWRSHTE